MATVAAAGVASLGIASVSDASFSATSSVAQSGVTSGVVAAPGAPSVAPVCTIVLGLPHVGLSLSWPASVSTYVTGYVVQRSTSATGPFTIVATVSGPASFLDATVTGLLTRYYYRVGATYQNWTSAAGPVGSGTTSGPCP